jgi:RimJ/RimL family protein N-acetyltransferase
MPDALLTGPVIPVIETERLKLRGHRVEDFAASVALWTDPAVTKFITGRPSTREECWSRLVRYVGHWALMGFGYWAVEDRATCAFVGELGFADYKRTIEPSLDGIPEIGWVISPAFHGLGYATEGVRAAVAWGDRHFGSRPTACIMAPENLASARVAGKAGYREVLKTTYRGEPSIMFRREGPRTPA